MPNPSKTRNNKKIGYIEEIRCFIEWRGKWR
jgi:hypothetical protein